MHTDTQNSHKLETITQFFFNEDSFPFMLIFTQNLSNDILIRLLT